MRPDTGLRLQTGSCRAWKTSHFLRAWKKQEGICGEERHLDGGTAGVRSRGFGTERVPDLTNVQAKMLLCESARDLGLPRNRQGHGMLQTDRFCLFCETLCGSIKKEKMKKTPLILQKLCEFMENAKNQANFDLTSL